MQQVMINLLKNAHEASDDPFHVSVSVAPAADGGVSIRISDRGPCMDEETMRQALLPFYSSKRGGAGLGLPLCREIVEAHGGRKRIRNRDGGGMTVIYHLPTHQPGRDPAPRRRTEDGWRSDSLAP